MKKGSRCVTRAGGWTAHQVDLLRRFYAASGSGPVDLGRAAALIGRDKTNVCRKARALGLTDQSRAKVAQVPLKPRPRTPDELFGVRSATMKRRIAEHGHPRGALGMKHTPEAKQAVADASRRAWADPSSGHNSESRKQRASDLMTERNAATPAANAYSRCVRGRRSDLGETFFRSAWEANYARFLNSQIERGAVVAWAYEVHTFWFLDILRGVRSYMPDFRVELPGGRVEWHEVKGWMDAKSRTKLARMAKYYPAEPVVIIGAEWFKQAVSGGLAATLHGWESKAQRRGPAGTTEITIESTPAASGRGRGSESVAGAAGEGSDETPEPNPTLIALLRNGEKVKPGDVTGILADREVQDFMATQIRVAKHTRRAVKGSVTIVLTFATGPDGSQMYACDTKIKSIVRGPVVPSAPTDGGMGTAPPA